MEQDKPPIHSAEPPEGQPEDQEIDPEQLERVVRREMRFAVEIADTAERRRRISEIYQIASAAGVDPEALNAWYEEVLGTMERPRGFSDEIEHARSAVTGEQVQVWPYVPAEHVRLGGEALRYALGSIDSSSAEEQ